MAGQVPKVETRPLGKQQKVAQQDRLALAPVSNQNRSPLTNLQFQNNLDVVVSPGQPPGRKEEDC